MTRRPDVGWTPVAIVAALEEGRIIEAGGRWYAMRSGRCVRLRRDVSRSTWNRDGGMVLAARALSKRSVMSSLFFVRASSVRINDEAFLRPQPGQVILSEPPTTITVIPPGVTRPRCLSSWKFDRAVRALDGFAYL